MKGFEVKIKQVNSFPEISRELILPEKITIYELEQIIKKIFCFDSNNNIFISPDMYWISDFISDNELFEKYINQKLYFDDYNFDNEPVNWYEISPIKIIEYEKNYTTLINSSDEINMKKMQKTLEKIPILKFKAYDIIINCEKTKEVITRELLIPEKTTFKQLEDIILIAFDTQTIHFTLNDDSVDESFRRLKKVYSENREISIEVKKTIYSNKQYPILLDFKGGHDPFDLWWEYYPKVENDKSQSCLDDFLI